MASSSVPAIDGCRPLPKCYSFAPLGFPASASLRFKDVNMKRVSRISLTQKSLVLACKSNVKASHLFSSNRSTQGTNQELNCLHSSGKQINHIAATSSQFLGREQGCISHTNTMLHQQHRSLTPPRAVYNDIFKFRYPEITEKPEWWWRTLACVPYLLALQISDAGYYIHPLLKHYQSLEELVFFVPGAIKRLPPWFIMVYFYFAYVGIVKNENWPHYLRFHLMMGMLLETAFQILCYTCNFFPLIHFNGRLGMYFCAAIAFTFIFTLLYCIRYALGGNYAEIPFISEAAYVHTLFNIGSFQRPF
ncbi:hypothetical protein SLEP1_g9781 [Rubroshorea leprosula]|uniref:Protein TIC 20 n=1 Tax=Rubroshorea leprosula TaxID=152421 RepID=A0AAV5IFD0_9ROSI|nr:hypothetical protein SLEP1_g9781 [Rubroshorea leprosula]